MTKRERRTDIPKLVATALAAAPALTVRLGFSYLRVKARSKKVSKVFRTTLERDGVPPDLARKLEESYRSELSIRKFLDMKDGGFLKGFLQR